MPAKTVESAKAMFFTGQLIEKIHEAHAKAVRCGRECVTGVVEAGRALNDLKSTVKHGRFEAILREQFSEQFSVVTAQRYMRLAREWPSLQAKLGPNAASGMTITSVLKLVYMPKASRETLLSNGLISKDETPITNTCLKGGEHEWEFDGSEGEAEEVCKKCHDPRAAHREHQTDREASGGEGEGGEGDGLDRGGVERSEDGAGEEGLSSGNTDRLFRQGRKLYEELTNLIDEIYRVKPSDIKDRARDHLNVSYMDFCAWEDEASRG